MAGEFEIEKQKAADWNEILRRWLLNTVCQSRRQLAVLLGEKIREMLKEVESEGRMIDPCPPGSEGLLD